MKALNNFFRKEQNPLFAKLKKLNHKHSFAKSFEKAFYLGGFVYTSENYERAIKAISEGTLICLLNEVQYNTLEDNVEFYLVQDEKRYYKIVAILDPVELYQREEVLDVIDCKDTSMYDQDHLQQIYP